MKQYALDSNIVSYYLKGNKTVIEKITSEAEDENSIIIPPIVFFEVKRWLLATNAVKKLTLFGAMCSKAGMGVIDKITLETASEIYSDLQKRGITIGDNDILIAAYCIQHDLTLVTNNELHFKHIANLQTINWL